MLKSFFTRLTAPENPPPWSSWSALNIIAIAFLGVIISTLLVAAMVGDTQYSFILSWALAAILITAFVFISRRTPEQRAALRLNPETTANHRLATVQSGLLLLLIGVGIAIALDVVSFRLTGLPRPEPELLRPYAVYINGLPILFISWALGLVLMVLLQPLAEELIFRGILLPALRKSFGLWLSLLFSAALYGLYHFVTYSSPSSDPDNIWYGLITPFIAGLVFGVVRLYTGSTRAAIITHAAFGLFAVIKLLTLVG